MPKNTIPRLRFKEFTDNWKEHNLGSIVDTKRPISYGIVQTGPSIEKGIKCIRVVDIINGRISKDNLITTTEFISNQYKRTILKKGDLVIALRGKIGESSVIENELVGSNLTRGVALIALTKEFNSYFLNQQLSSTKSKTVLERSLNGSALQELSIGVLRSILLRFPQFEEQTKIATFLSAIDEKIERQQRLLALWQAYKKGIMQQIFSQQLRFKASNGEGYPDWSIKKLNKICKIYDGTHQTPTYQKEGIPFYSVESVTGNNFTETKYISNEVFKKENERVKIDKGDILMTRIGDIGTAKYINWDVNASFYVSLALIKQCNNNNSEYICHFINSNFFQAELHKRTIHVAFPKKINLGEIGECLVKLPCIEEQTKIASFLSSLDGKIAHIERQLTSFREFKKGLLQQMFV